MKNILAKIKAWPVPPLLRNKYLITGLVFLLWVLLFDPINLIDWLSEKRHLHELNKEKIRLEYDIQATKRKIDAFAHPDSLEKMAREKFYFVGEGEEIFLIEE
jgi:cell division protein FtsB